MTDDEPVVWAAGEFLRLDGVVPRSRFVVGDGEYRTRLTPPEVTGEVTLTVDRETYERAIAASTPAPAAWTVERHMGRPRPRPAWRHPLALLDWLLWPDLRPYDVLRLTVPAVRFVNADVAP